MPRHLPIRIVLLTTVASIAALGCSDPAAPALLPGPPPVFSVSYPPSVRLSGRADAIEGRPGTWRLAVRFANAGSATAHVEHGACSVAIWIYPAAATSGPPVWDNRLPPNVACIAIGYSADIPPGAAYDLPAGLFSLQHAAGLPAGRYRVVLAVQPQPGGNAPLVVLPAGEVTLTP